MSEASSLGAPGLWDLILEYRVEKQFMAFFVQ